MHDARAAGQHSCCHLGLLDLFFARSWLACLQGQCTVRSSINLPTWSFQTTLFVVCAGMIRRLLRLERQLASSRLSSNIRHNASLKNHCSSKRVTNDLESTTDKLKRGINFAHRLLGNHHVRTGRRHKATKGSLSLLKRQQVKARRQRLALKKQLQRALAQQSMLERQMERLQQILDVVLQVSTECTVIHALRHLLCVLYSCCVLFSMSWSLSYPCMQERCCLTCMSRHVHLHTTMQLFSTQAQML